MRLLWWMVDHSELPFEVGRRNRLPPGFQRRHVAGCLWVVGISWAVSSCASPLFWWVPTFCHTFPLVVGWCNCFYQISTLIFFALSHRSIFLNNIGSPPVCLGILGGGKMEFIPCNIDREEFRRLSSVRSFVTPMKSSMYTSCRLIGVLGVDVVVGDFGSILCSRGWGGNCCFALNSVVMVSRAASELAQKNGGDSHHPICRLYGTTSWMPSRLSGVKPSIGGRIYQKFHASSLLTTSLQKPSCMSSLENMNMQSMLWLSAIVATICCSYVPSYAIACWGALLMVVSLTEVSWCLPSQSLKEKSSITRKSLLLCGIHAAGEILIFWVVSL